MAQGESDRNLLFGILALQMDFITRDALIAAMNAWVVQKGQPLAASSSSTGDLDRTTSSLLDPLVAGTSIGMVAIRRGAWSRSARRAAPPPPPRHRRPRMQASLASPGRLGSRET